MTKETTPLEQLQKIPEVADTCQVSEGKTVWRWIRAKELSAIKLGSQWRVAPKDLRAFLRDRRHG